ncbi:MAG: rhodanese-like domain-containing protein [Planctomycetota bacterium]
MKLFVVGLLTLPAVAGAAGLAHSLISGPMVLEPEDPVVTTFPSSDNESSHEDPPPPTTPSDDTQAEPEPALEPTPAIDAGDQSQTETHLVLDSLEIELGVANTLFERGLADFVDARRPSEFEEGHILGAMNITPGMLATGTPAAIEAGFLTEDRPIVVYCGGGDCDDSHVVVQRLQEMGFMRTHVFTGGFPEWQNADLATGSGPDPFAG